MKIGTFSEISKLPAVSAAVRLVAHMHRTMHVTHQVNEKLQ